MEKSGTNVSLFSFHLGLIANTIPSTEGCGSCWAFSTAELVYAYRKKQGKHGIYSPQQLVDCDHNVAFGCGGGNVFAALSYIKDNGIASEQNYPYADAEKTCTYDPSQSAATIKEAQRLFTNGNETLMR